MNIVKFNELTTKCQQIQCKDKKTFNALFYLIRNGLKDEKIKNAVDIILENYTSYSIKNVTAKNKCSTIVEFDFNKMPQNVSKALQDRAQLLEAYMLEQQKKDEENIISLLS